VLPGEGGGLRVVPLLDAAGLSQRDNRYR
jgi:hypothetical protein